jgi:hypothetical protein
MARNKVTLNHRGLANLLTSTEMHRLVQDVAEQIGRNVEAQGITVGDKDGGAHEIPLPVKVEVTTTDRAHGSVILAHPAGIAVQAKHGALPRPAEAGRGPFRVEVKQRQGSRRRAEEQAADEPRVEVSTTVPDVAADE